MSHLIIISLFLFLITYNAVNILARKYTENNVVKIPTPNVIEKPLIGPEPKINNITAYINVVILASKIAFLDFV